MSQVTRRRVFYIPGYDPIHPRRYRELYRREGAEQAQISGYNIALSPKTGGGRYGWRVNARFGATDVTTDVEVLVWSDIVRASMTTGILGTYMQLLRTAYTYIASGALLRLSQLRLGPIAAALYPIGMLIAQFLFAVLLAALAAWALGHLHPWLSPLGLALIPAVLLWFKSLDNKLFAYYLMHDYAYSARWRGANPPELEARMTEFQVIIADALTHEVDEVLIVGHSSGAHLGVSILADLIRAGQVPPRGPKLAFLSLGQVVPMVSFLPDAWRLRGDLRVLSEHNDITWVDVTAPSDGCAFALCDPVKVTGVATEKTRWPLVFSAAFGDTLGPDKLAKLKRRYFKLHFQYLCAFDRPRDYDYFQITAGPQLLSDRYRTRKPSKSVITRATNRYRSTRP